MVSDLTKEKGGSGYSPPITKDVVSPRCSRSLQAKVQEFGSLHLRTLISWSCSLGGSGVRLLDGFLQRSGRSWNIADWKRRRSSGLCLASSKNTFPVAVNCPDCANISLPPFYLFPLASLVTGGDVCGEGRNVVENWNIVEVDKMLRWKGRKARKCSEREKREQGEGVKQGGGRASARPAEKWSTKVLHLIIEKNITLE